MTAPAPTARRTPPGSTLTTFASDVVHAAAACGIVTSPNCVVAVTVAYTGHVTHGFVTRGATDRCVAVRPARYAASISAALRTLPLIRTSSSAPFSVASPPSPLT